MNRYRRGGIPQYQGDEGGVAGHDGQFYSGEGDDVGPAIQEQREDVRERNPRKTSWLQRLANTILYPLSYVGENITEWPKSAIGWGYDKDEWGSKDDGRMPYEGLYSGDNPQWYGQYGGVPSNLASSDRESVTEYGPQGNPGQARSGGGSSVVVIWPNKPRGPQGGGGTDVPEDYDNYGRAQSGGLTNRVMRYQGDTGSNIIPLNEEGNPQEMPIGEAQQSSDMVQQMMSMLRFSGGGGVKSLPIENQANIRKEFESMTEAERQQWINFMTGPGTTEQSPTRADPEAELIERIMQQQGPQVPLGPESFQ